MVDEQKTTGGDERDAQTGQENPQDSDNKWAELPEWARKEYEATKARLSEVNNESAGRRHELERLRQEAEALKKAEQKRLAESGNYKELAERAAAEAAELAAYKERYEKIDKRLRESNEKRIADIPEARRSLIPKDYLTPDELSDWLDANARLLYVQEAPDIDAGAGAGVGDASNVKVTEADRIAAEQAKAQGYKVTPEQIAKRRAARTK